MSTPILSIITINRNNADGLRKTIESVLSQDVSDKTQVEYIIIDGASTDNSVEVIKSFENNQSNKLQITKWISEPDSGIYNAMNKGIKMATGELIGIMNSGDTYLPKIFKKIIDMHKINSDSILYGAMKTIKNSQFESIWGYHYSYLERQMIPHLATFIPNKIYQQIGFFDENYKIAADYDLFLRFYNAKVPFYFTDEIICSFNLDGISQNNARETDFETKHIKQKYGYYIPPSKKQKIKNIIKKFLEFKL